MKTNIVDVFADHVFGGNPAAVCVLEQEDWPSDHRLTQIAGELNQPATAFARPSPADDVDWDLRWFTPSMELRLCGHATLAATHILHSDLHADRTAGTIRFGTSAGTLQAGPAAGLPAGRTGVELPAAQLTETAVPTGIAAAVDVEPAAAFHTGRLRDLLLVLPAEQAVRDARPDAAAIARITDREGLRGVVITAPAATGSDHDFVSRFFDPGEGIPEDHVTGSAHTALGPYWAARLGRADLAGFQASARGGTVTVHVDGDHVRLSGRCITVFDGRMLV